MINDIFSKTNFEIISNKKNIKKKYDSNRIDKNISNYKNINEVKHILSLTKKKKENNEHDISMISKNFEQ